MTPWAKFDLTEAEYKTAMSMHSYAAEVRTVSCRPGVFTSNLLRWPLTPAGKQGAEQYALDLSCRWTAVEEWRVVESTDEPNRGVPA